MKRLSLIAVPALALILLGASCAPVNNTNGSATNKANTNATAAKTYDLTYAGQDGKTALELLAQSHVVDVTPAGFVNAIDGRHPADHQFWAFYINDQQATVGAKDAVTKTGDRIGWRLESF